MQDTSDLEKQGVVFLRISAEDNLAGVIRDKGLKDDKGWMKLKGCPCLEEAPEEVRARHSG